MKTVKKSKYHWSIDYDTLNVSVAYRGKTLVGKINPLVPDCPIIPWIDTVFIKAKDENQNNYEVYFESDFNNDIVSFDLYWVKKV
jgi:hypothetical protein